jgi:hypothetical protein
LSKATVKDELIKIISEHLYVNSKTIAKKGVTNFFTGQVKLCKIITDEEKQEVRKLLKVSKSVAILARLRFNYINNIGSIYEQS